MVAPQPQMPEVIKDNSKEIELIVSAYRSQNACRGEVEGRYDEICSKYLKCSECWNDYGKE